MTDLLSGPLSVNAATIGRLALLLIGLGVAGMVVVVGSARLSVPAALGLRGWKRQQALESSESLRAMDPAIRLIAAWIAVLPIPRWRSKAARLLAFAGDYKGLDPDSWFALCFLHGVVGAGVGLLMVTSFNAPGMVVGLAGAVTAYFQFSAVEKARDLRRKLVDRGLPGSIDLMSLCVSAGLSFPQAVRHIVEVSVDKRDPIIEEMGLVLRQIDLGNGRAFALQTLAMRVPTASVRDFVSAVVQADAKGTPLREVLAQQAVIMRDRRSTQAEEATAKADVKLKLPLIMMMGVMFLMMMGPMAIKMMTTKGAL